METWTDGQIYGQIDRWTDEQMDRVIYGQIDTWSDGQIGREVDRKTSYIHT